MKECATLIIVLSSFLGFSQKKLDQGFKNELSILTDNDYFFSRDYYYSAGQEITFRKQISFLDKPDTAKVIFNIKAGIKIFTPKGISLTDVTKMDRPYAGYDYLGVGLTRFNKINAGYNFAIDVGITGPQSGIEQFQAWWHKTFDLRTPKGWIYQIKNQTIINASFQYWNSWKLMRSVDVVSSSKIQVGTGTNKVSQDFTFRFFNFNPLKSSQFSHTMVSSQPTKKKEFFIFGGMGLDYVASNTFIEGSLSSESKSTLGRKALPIIFRQQIGAMYSSNQWAFSATANGLTKEVENGVDHLYGSIEMSFRF